MALIQSNDSRRHANEWTPDEHAKYLESLVRFPNGPWKARAAFIGTRTTRQVMTHYQKIKLRLKRHARGLLPAGRPRGACVKKRPEQTDATLKFHTTTPLPHQASSCDKAVFVPMELPASPVSPARVVFAWNAWMEGDVVFDPLVDGELQGSDPFPWTVL